MSKHIIQTTLNQLCQDKQIRCLHAIESGSRAWGFMSADSDYDVRLIYCHKPEWYFSIYPNKDTFEFIDNQLFDVPFDIGGWDIKKALQLLYKSNAAVFEWLNSPIVYQSNHQFFIKIHAVSHEFFNPKAVYHHYQGMAKTAYQDLDITKPLKLKKWFYLLRALLASYWIIKHHTMPSVNITPLLDFTNEKSQILALMAYKQCHKETQYDTLSPSLQKLTIDLWHECQNHDLPFYQGDIGILNKIFQEVVCEI